MKDNRAEKIYNEQDLLSMLENLLMPPHPLRQRLRSHIIQRAHHSAIVEDLQRGLTDEFFDVDLFAWRGCRPCVDGCVCRYV